MIIDTCYESIIAKLTSLGKIKEISNQLLSLNRNDERVLFVYKIFEDLKAFPHVQDVKKSDEVSVYYRNLGNTCFQQSEYHKAWQYYNLSLLYAITNSENYCLALSNRSAVFYELNKFSGCLDDINRVLSLEYPQKILEKLTKRANMCKEALSKESKKTSVDKSKLNDLLDMKSPKDSRYVCASSKLAVVHTDQMGRHVIAKEDIKVGEILVEEDPYFILLLKKQIICGCSYCLSRNLNLIPCDSCCFALYCSVECKERAWREYHSVECPLMATLLDMDFTKLELLALRTVIKARHDHKDWNSLIRTIDEADANYYSEFRGHVKFADKWLYDSKYYASIHTLATNIEKRSVSDIFQKSVTAVVFLKFLERYTNFLKIDHVEDYEKILRTVAGLLLLHLMTSPTNMHGISTNVESEDGKFLEEVSLASAPYAFLSLINHSCAPNVVRFSILGTGRTSLFSLRPIKKGMQIFDNYGSHHALEDRMSRQKSLKFQYKFICSCEACTNNWQTYIQLHLSPISLPEHISKAKDKILTLDTIENLQKGDLNTAVNIYQPLCDLCEMLEPYAPCIHLCDCQESLKQCLAIFEGLAVYGSTPLIEWKPSECPMTNTSGSINRYLTNMCKKLNL